MTEINVINVVKLNFEFLFYSDCISSSSIASEQGFHLLLFSLCLLEVLFFSTINLVLVPEQSDEDQGSNQFEQHPEKNVKINRNSLICVCCLQWKPSRLQASAQSEWNRSTKSCLSILYWLILLLYVFYNVDFRIPSWFFSCEEQSDFAWHQVDFNKLYTFVKLGLGTKYKVCTAGWYKVGSTSWLSTLFCFPLIIVCFPPHQSSKHTYCIGIKRLFCLTVLFLGLFHAHLCLYPVFISAALTCLRSPLFSYLTEGCRNLHSGWWSSNSIYSSTRESQSDRKRDGDHRC